MIGGDGRYAGGYPAEEFTMIHGFRFLVTGLLVLVVAAGCDVLEDATAGVRGNGNVSAETREVAEFTAIELRGNGDVFVAVTGTASLTVEAEENLLPLLGTEVENGRLVIEPTERITPTEDVTYTISVEALDGALIAGSGLIHATGLDGDTFAGDISGSGLIEPEGEVARLMVGISGSGSYSGEELTAATGDVDIAGSGDAVVNVTDELTVSISGSGAVEYLGDPALTQSVTGSGQVTKR